MYFNYILILNKFILETNNKLIYNDINQFINLKLSTK